jgi:hypothetical protein
MSSDTSGSVKIARISREKATFLPVQLTDIGYLRRNRAGWFGVGQKKLVIAAKIAGCLRQCKGVVVQ